jgi:hypothetical protein
VYVTGVFASDNTTPSKKFTTPQAFMDLYFDFTGNQNKAYPKDKINASLALIHEIKKEKKSASMNPPIILFINSSLYIYDSHGKKIFGTTMRTNTHMGFYAMTAVSHIGPALSYYAKVKELGGEAWRKGLQNMFENIKAVRKINKAKSNNWLDELDAPPWAPHKKAIHNMVDYACSMSGNYISAVLQGKAFTEEALNADFLSGTSTQYPIPYNNIMVGTFMLTALESIGDLYHAISPLKLDWAHAKVIIRNVAGGNVTAGLTKESNWFVNLVLLLSNGKTGPNHIFISPYAKVGMSLGRSQLSEEDLNYYRYAVWASTYNRVYISKLVFKNIPNIKIPRAPSLPGDYIGTNPSDMMAFMKRLKYSLANATQMLSNTVGFWMVGEFRAKHGDLDKIVVPGLTTGFPKGVAAYPANSPEIAS